MLLRLILFLNFFIYFFVIKYNISSLYKLVTIQGTNIKKKLDFFFIFSYFFKDWEGLIIY